MQASPARHLYLPHCTPGASPGRTLQPLTGRQCDPGGQQPRLAPQLVDPDGQMSAASACADSNTTAVKTTADNSARM